MSKKLNKKQMKSAKGGCSGPSAREMAIEVLVASGVDYAEAVKMTADMQEAAIYGPSGLGVTRAATKK